MEEIVIEYKWESPKDKGNSCIAYVDMRSKCMYITLSENFSPSEARKITDGFNPILYDRILLKTKDSFVKLITALRNSGFIIIKEK